MNRRAVSRRAALTALGTVATAGCLSSLPFQSSDDVQLGSLLVSRPGEIDASFEDVTQRELADEDTDSPAAGRTYPIRLIREADLAFERVITLAPSEYVLIDPTWSTDPATYTLLYASETSVNRLEISAQTGGVDTDHCNYILMNMDLGSNAPLEHDVRVVNSDHPLVRDQDEIELTY